MVLHKQGKNLQNGIILANILKRLNIDETANTVFQLILIGFNHEQKLLALAPAGIVFNRLRKR